jgi:hypothetical protein
MGIIRIIEVLTGFAIEQKVCKYGLQTPANSYFNIQGFLCRLANKIK